MKNLYRNNHMIIRLNDEEKELFINTRKEHDSKSKVLERHLIQSFLPGETDPAIAHKIGKELCEKHIKNEYEYVIDTHIDRRHIQNHIIFNEEVLNSLYLHNYLPVTLL